MNARTVVNVFTLSLLVAACAAPGEKDALRITPKGEARNSPVVREVLPQSAPAAADTAARSPMTPDSAAPSLANAAPSSIPPAASAPIVPAMPAGTLYVCRGMVNGQLQHTAIEYEPKTRTVCARHPEMGVCQYEREACRTSGGQVFDAAGKEITRQTEAEYDRKVMRVRFRAG